MYRPLERDIPVYKQCRWWIGLCVSVGISLMISVPTYVYLDRNNSLYDSDDWVVIANQETTSQTNPPYRVNSRIEFSLANSTCKLTVAPDQPNVQMAVHNANSDWPIGKTINLYWPKSDTSIRHTGLHLCSFGTQQSSLLVFGQIASALCLILTFLYVFVKLLLVWEWDPKLSYSSERDPNFDNHLYSCLPVECCICRTPPKF